MTRLLLLLTLILQAFVQSPALAHEVRPALLEVRRNSQSVCLIDWKQPVAGTVAIRLIPRISGGWLDQPPLTDTADRAHRAMRWKRQGCTLQELEGRMIAVSGLDSSITNVVIRVDYGDGSTAQHLLNPGDAAISLARTRTVAPAVNAYLRLGVKHILTGIDHLTFMAALILLVGLRRRLIGVVTAFTIAHSLTLCATALGWFHPWPELIESLVALSIVFVAAEVLRARRGIVTATIRWPALASLSFGLLHGFAFAGALSQIGLPKSETLLALLLFNLGVEIGQLLFVGFVLLLVLVGRAMITSWPRWSRPLPPYAIGSIAAFWLIDRLTALFA